MRNQTKKIITMFRINEALAAAKDAGRKVKKIELAGMLWPNSTESAQKVNMGQLCNGKTQSIKPEWVPKICAYCGCDANYLFNVKP